MGHVGGNSNFGARVQARVKSLFETADIPLRECPGSGNKHRSDSDLTNRALQIECKGRYSADGINMPKKTDWRKLRGEASGAGRMPLLITAANEDFTKTEVLVTLRLTTLLYLMKGVGQNEW